MKHLIQKINSFSLVVLTLLVITSCEDNDNQSLANDSLLARFTRTVDGKTFTFINISENATSYLWDFGDGTTSVFSDPVKRFLNGTYTVTLTAFDENGNSSTFEERFTLDGCTDETAENLDPANGNLNWTFLNADDNAAFDPFGNIGGSVVANPVEDEVNASCNVFSYNKITGCEIWSGAGYNLNTPLDFSSDNGKMIKIKVLAETQVSKVTLVLEQTSQSPVKLTREATISEVGKWEELTFDFSDVTSGTYKVMIMYIDRDVACDGDVYYFDDIIQQ